MTDLRDILNEEDDFKDDELLKYLQDSLSKDDQHKIEKQMAGSAFINDAVEGLQNIHNKKSIEQYVEDLNKQLHKQVAAKKQRKEKRKLKDQPWIVITVIVVLALCIITYAVIRYHQKNTNPLPKNNTGQIN